jgi:prolyl-tRNA editing enzyme YbaK/EbsC (Cys-tRNA(Pro) deacylase)
MNNSAFQNICQLLDTNQVSYRVLDHPPCRTSEESALARSRAGAPEAIGAKALLCKLEVIPHDEFCVVVLPGPARLDAQALKGLLAVKRFRFATPEEMQAVCGVLPGCLPPFGPPVFPQIAQFVIDPSLFDYEYLGFNAANFERSIVLRSMDYLRAVKPFATFTRITVKPHDGEERA